MFYLEIKLKHEVLVLNTILESISIMNITSRHVNLIVKVNFNFITK